MLGSLDIFEKNRLQAADRCARETQEEKNCFLKKRIRSTNLGLHVWIKMLSNDWQRIYLEPIKEKHPCSDGPLLADDQYPVEYSAPNDQLPLFPGQSVWRGKWLP